MTKNILYMMMGLAGALAIAGLTGCSARAEAQENDGLPFSQRENDERRVPVQTIAVQPRTFVEYGEYLGEARGISEVTLAADAGGRVVAVHAREGDSVSQGCSLAEIDPGKARTAYQTAVLNERLAREAYEREQRFLEQGNSFQLKVDQAHLAWLQAQSALIDAEQLQESAFAVSPIGGIVVRRLIEPHQELDPGDPTFVVADLSRMRITVDVPEADMSRVQELDEAEVTFAALPEVTFVGTPTGFARARSERTLSYEVDVEVDNSDGVILSGQTARVRLALRHVPDSIVLPSRAVLTRNNETFVLVVRDGIVSELPVTTGASNNTETVIVDGLVSGDQVVIDGLNRLADGSAVEIIR